MDNKDCDTLEKVYAKPPSTIPWIDVKKLLEAIVNDYGGFFSAVPSRMYVTLADTPLGDNILILPYVPIMYQGMVEKIEEFLVTAGVTLCNV